MDSALWCWAIRKRAGRLFPISGCVCASRGEEIRIRSRYIANDMRRERGWRDELLLATLAVSELLLPLFRRAGTGRGFVLNIPRST